MEVPRALEAAPHVFVMVTGEAARELGAKTKSTKLWGLKEWIDAPLELELEDGGQGAGDPGVDPDELDFN